MLPFRLSSSIVT